MILQSELFIVFHCPLCIGQSAELIQCNNHHTDWFVVSK